MSIKITATASGSLTPPQQPAPSAVTNGDFRITAQTGVTGDGETDDTTWTFDFTADQNFAVFSPSRPLTSALLTLTLTPRSPSGLIVTDAVGIQLPGLGGIGGGKYGSPSNLPELKGLALDHTYTIHLELLNRTPAYTSAAILAAFFGTGGRLPMDYNNDAIISSARLDLIQDGASFQYAAKFVVGQSEGEVVAPGAYFTAVNVHNPSYTTIRFRVKVAVGLPGLKAGPVSKFIDVRLGPDEALEVDTRDIFKIAETRAAFLKGFVVIETDVELDVIAVYTAAAPHAPVATLHTERVPARRHGSLCKPGPAPAPGLTACVDFEPPFTLGTQYGTPVGQHPGDVAFTTANGIVVRVADFLLAGGGGTFGLAKIDAAPVPFGSGQSLRANNINLVFDFSQIGFVPSQVHFEFLDLGGLENIAVNGSAIFAGELAAAPNPIGGANISVTSAPVAGGKKGTVTITGGVKTLTIGGQEFWIDNLCAK